MKLRKNGKRTPSMASYCILCDKEDKKIIEQRRYELKLEYNRKWRKENRDKVNKSNRKSYLKKVGELTKSKNKYKLPKSGYKFNDYNYDTKNMYLMEKL
tara:strand:- start:267 stop:563 length:297 start_codon:yes stop_codon:yes gene_type:complete